MDRLELPKIDLPWYVTSIFIFLSSIALAAFWGNAAAISGGHAYMAWSIVVIFALMDLFLISLLFVKRHRYLLASIPPVLVTESRWFGKFSYINKCELKGAAWVRVIYSSEGNFDVEVGTHKFITTSICIINYSKQNIAVAEKWSADIAHFLKLENKGSALVTLG